MIVPAHEAVGNFACDFFEFIFNRVAKRRGWNGKDLISDILRRVLNRRGRAPRDKIIGATI